MISVWPKFYTNTANYQALRRAGFTYEVASPEHRDFMGQPFVYAVDANYLNRGELYLSHQYSGLEVEIAKAKEVLINLRRIWGRPVHLQTLVDGKPTMLSFDGTDHAIRTGGEIDDPRRNAPGKTR